MLLFSQYFCFTINIWMENRNWQTFLFVLFRNTRLQEFVFRSQVHVQNCVWNDSKQLKHENKTTLTSAQGHINYKLTNINRKMSDIQSDYGENFYNSQDTYDNFEFHQMNHCDKIMFQISPGGTYKKTSMSLLFLSLMMKMTLNFSLVKHNLIILWQN